MLNRIFQLKKTKVQLKKLHISIKQQNFVTYNFYLNKA